MRLRRPLIALVGAALAAAPLAATSGAQAAATVTVTPSALQGQHRPDGLRGVRHRRRSLHARRRVTRPTGCRRSSRRTASAAPRTTRPASAGPSPRGATPCSPTRASASAARAARSRSTTPTGTARPASQLVSYLGGKAGIAFTDAGTHSPAPTLDVVQRDAKDHAGMPLPTILGSAWSAAPTAVRSSSRPPASTRASTRSSRSSPGTTCRTRSAPNNTDFRPRACSLRTSGRDQARAGPSASRARARRRRDERRTAIPSRLVGCPNFADFVCPALVDGRRDRLPRPTRRSRSLRHASVATYLSAGHGSRRCSCRARTTRCSTSTRPSPTYQALRAQGTPVKMIWHSWGHSGAPRHPASRASAAPTPPPSTRPHRVASWFGHYLKDSAADPGPEFTYFRDWVNYTGIATPRSAGDATRSARSGVLPVRKEGPGHRPGGPSRPARQSFLTPPGGLPTSASGIDVFAPQLPARLNLPGTYAAWTSAPLTSDLHVVGSPALNLRVRRRPPR